VPLAEGPRIVYPAAVLASARRQAEAKSFLAFLRQPASAAIFARYKFVPLPEPKPIVTFLRSRSTRFPVLVEQEVRRSLSFDSSPDLLASCFFLGLVRRG